MPSIDFLEKHLPKAETKASASKNGTTINTTNSGYSDFEKASICANDAATRGINIVEGYPEWWLTLASLASLGEQARDLAHQVSRQSSKYNYEECNKKFSEALRNSSITGIDYFLKRCQDAGVNYHTTSIDKAKKQPKQEFTPSENGVHKYTYSFFEIWGLSNTVVLQLIENLIPAIGLVVLLGEDGIGKSQIARQLALCIAFKIKVFMGMTLNARYWRAAFLATEDSKDDFIKAAKKQVFGLGQYHNISPDEPSLDFIEGGSFENFQDILNELEIILSRNKYDLVVIDALSDLFTYVDGDPNSNSHARKILNPLQALANKHETLVLILHHASKSAMRAKREKGAVLVEKNDCQGASAITQKPRTVLALSNDPKEGVNYLHCVKANGLSKHFKENALKIQLDGETLLHQYKGTISVFENEEKGPRKTALEVYEIEKGTHLEILGEVFRTNPKLGYGELWTRIKEAYSKGYHKIGDNRAKQFADYYKSNQYVLQENMNKGKYYINPSV